MPPAARAHPELIGRPRRAGRGVAHLHVGAAALAADAEIGLRHARDSITTLRWNHDRVMIPAIVLAAGRSSRMGRPKASLPIGADTFLSRIVRTFLDAGVGDVVVVV